MNKRYGTPMTKICTAVLCAAALCHAAVPTPKEHFGYTPGDDFKLADYNDIISYFQKLAQSSDRILLSEFGKTAMGKPMYIAYISSPSYLDQQDTHLKFSHPLISYAPFCSETKKLA